MAQNATFNIELPDFEGPLDLLLHLIRKHELDIMDLPISFVAERYLHYLALMRQLDLDVASEYLLMAATLAHIKSRMLLPTAFPEQEDEDGEMGEDPREELIRQLLEYQKYKAAAEQLGASSVMGRDVFGRGAPPPTTDGPAPLAEIGLFKLLDAFEAILKKLKDRLSFEVSAERITVGERISQVTEILREKQFCRFDELFEGLRSRYELVVTFLAILEMAKMKISRIYQADHTSPIYLQFALLDADAPSIPPPSDTA
jgi:segregation and condensation protein A